MTHRCHRGRTRIGSSLVAVVACITLAGCASTYVDTDMIDAATDDTVASEATSTTAPTPGDTTPTTIDLGDGIDRLRDLLDQLSDQVVDDDAAAAELLADVDTIWAAMEPTVRADHPEVLFPIEQAVLLATTSVERRRPADASKGALILRDLAATLTD